MKILEELKGNDVMDVLEKHLRKNRVNEINIVMQREREDLEYGHDTEDYIAIYDRIQSVYEFNLEKLGYTRELKNKSITKKTKLVKLISYLEGLPLSDTNFLSTVLTAGTILSTLKNNPEDLNEDNLYLLSTAFISIPIKNYEVYTKLVDQEVLDLIADKTMDYKERRNVCYDLLDYCEYNSSGSKEDILSLVDNYNYQSKLK